MFPSRDVEPEQPWLHQNVINSAPVSNHSHNIITLYEVLSVLSITDAHWASIMLVSRGNRQHIIQTLMSFLPFDELQIRANLVASQHNASTGAPSSELSIPAIVRNECTYQSKCLDNATKSTPDLERVSPESTTSTAVAVQVGVFASLTSSYSVNQSTGWWIWKYWLGESTSGTAAGFELLHTQGTDAKSSVCCTYQ